MMGSSSCTKILSPTQDAVPEATFPLLVVLLSAHSGCTPFFAATPIVSHLFRPSTQSLSEAGQ